MNQINIRRLILGGLLAGLAFNILGLASGVIMDLEETFMETGWEPNPATGFLHFGLRFLLGIAAVFLYAGMRPRFGAGPKTAIIVGLLIWFVGYLTMIIIMAELNIFTPWQAWFAVVWGLGEACLATLAGAWFYREE